MGYTTMYGKLYSGPMFGVNAHAIDTAFDSPAII